MICDRSRRTVLNWGVILPMPPGEIGQCLQAFLMVTIGDREDGGRGVLLVSSE